MKMLKFSLMLMVLLLCACSQSRLEEGAGLARQAGWEWVVLPAGTFDLAIAQPTGRVGDILTVYIEGDGYAFVHPSQPAMDPTPKDPVALRMALADTTLHPIVWLGRPCQYTAHDRQPGRNCKVDYWTNRRYATEVIESLSSAIDTVKQQTGAQQIKLIGFSGGGALAVLVAARRHDVQSIITVAANLDTDYWMRRDGLASLNASLNPADVAAALAQIPQTHFTGAHDAVVGTDVVQSYMNHLPANNAVRLIEIPDYTHACCWAQNWAGLLASSL